MVVNNCAAALLLAMAALAQGQAGARLARGADRDRRGVPDPRHPGRLGSAARRGRHDEPDEDRRLPSGGHGQDRADPQGAPLELPRGRIHGRAGGHRPRRPSPASTTSRSSTTSAPGSSHHGHGHPADEPSRLGRARAGSRPRHVLRGQAARRATGRHHRRDGGAPGAAPPPPDRPRRPHRQDADGRARTGARDHRGRQGRRRSPCSGCSGSLPRSSAAGRSSCPRRSAASSRERASCAASRRSGVARCRGRSSRRGGFGSGCRMRPSFAARLRTGTPSAFSRMEDGFILLDCRTVTDAQIPHLARAVHYALEGDEEHDHDVHGGEDDPDGGGDRRRPDRGDARA